MTLMMMMSMTMSDRGRHIGQASQVWPPVKDLLTPPISKFLVSVLVKVTLELIIMNMGQQLGVQ